MKATSPTDRTLDDTTKLRPFRVDTPKIKALKAATGMDEVELTRRALHVGIPKLAKALGITLKEDEVKKAA